MAQKKSTTVHTVGRKQARCSKGPFHSEARHGPATAGRERPQELPMGDLDIIYLSLLIFAHTSSYSYIYMCVSVYVSVCFNIYIYIYICRLVVYTCAGLLGNSQHLQKSYSILWVLFMTLPAGETWMDFFSLLCESCFVPNIDPKCHGWALRWLQIKPK